MPKAAIFLTFRLKSDRNYLGKVLLENLPEPKMQVLSDLAEFLNFVIFFITLNPLNASVALI